MHDTHKENESASENPKPTSQPLSSKELLEKRKQFLNQVKTNRGSSHNSDPHSKKSNHSAAGHTHRVHKPQGG